MPNWCMNVVEAKCPSMEAALDLIEKVTTEQEDYTGHKQKVLDFTKIVPEPTHESYIESKSAPGAVPEWYDWRVANWGTKWGLSECLTDVQGDDEQATVVFQFDTAWSPSTPVTAKLSEMFPEIMFAHSYDEPGVGFGGYEVLVGGDVVDISEGDSRASSWPEIAEWSVDYEWHEHRKKMAAS